MYEDASNCNDAYEAYDKNLGLEERRKTMMRHIVLLI